MGFYLYLNEDGYVRGFFDEKPQVLDKNFPKGKIDEKDLDDFKINFYKYKLIDGKLVKQNDPVDELTSLKQVATSSQRILSQLVNSCAQEQVEINKQDDISDKQTDIINKLVSQFAILQQQLANASPGPYVPNDKEEKNDGK